MGRLIELDRLSILRADWRNQDKQVVFTNGCFDILHRGHVEYLQKARDCGDVLIVGLNADDSVRRLKGEGRPIMPQEDRAVILSALSSVDYIVYFEQDTPEQLIRQLQPDVLVKGADYRIEEIIGHDVVQAGGGKVIRISLTSGKATRGIIQTIIDRFCSSHDKIR